MTNSDEKDKDDKKPFEWTEGKLRDLYNFLTSLFDKYVAFQKETSTAEQKYMEATAHHDRRVLYLMIGFLSIVVIAMSLLTYEGKVSGEALLFLVGAVTGYVFAFVEKFVFGPPAVTVEAPP